MSRWVRSEPKPGRRIFALFLVWGSVAFVLMFVALVVFVVKWGGQALGVLPTPPPPTPASAAADLGSGNPSRELKGFRTLQKFTPDRDQIEVAKALAQLVTKGRGHSHRQAIKPLGDWGSSNDADALAGVVQNTHWGNSEERREAIVALDKLGGMRAYELLAECLKHEAHRALVVAALKRHGQELEVQHEVEFCVLQVLRDEKTPPTGLVEALNVLAAVGSKNSLDAIKPLEEDPALGEPARRAVAAIEARKK